eukprot:gb/GFBE01002415.1/.p1 GENE.gb/GFBE01002415.1/~~gb/GFBE01002415.1/.p1  ORF type:complete len:298 (+),score=79.71 gb/GFBE01002415.1/:1-894(+)
MEVVGEQLYAMISLVHPELAPKLTGMLLQLGEEECQTCLHCQETLAFRLDEAIQILDGAGGLRTAAKKTQAPVPDSTERRIDPEDGQARTFQELRAMCQGQYTPKEIEEYWKTCSPVAPGAKPTGQAAQLPGRAENAEQPAPPSPPAAPSQAASEAEAVKENYGDLAGENELVPGLAVWLAELRLSGYEKAAASWAEEQGACELEEIVENLEDFASDLGLKPLEKKRLMQGAESAVAVAAEAVAKAAEEAEKAAPPVAEAKPNASVANAKEDQQVEAGGEDYPALGANGAGKKGRRR